MAHGYSRQGRFDLIAQDYQGGNNPEGRNEGRANLSPEQARRLNKRSERERISGLQMQHREKDDTAYGKTLSQQQEGHRPMGSSSLL